MAQGRTRKQLVRAASRGRIKSAELRIGPELAALSEEIMASLPQDVVVAARRGLAELASQAVRFWPVGRDRKERQFHSIEKISHGVFVSPDGVTARIVNTAWWSGLIGTQRPPKAFRVKTKGRVRFEAATGANARSDKPWIYLMRNPMTSLGEKVAEAALQSIDDARP